MRDIVDIQTIDACRLALQLRGSSAAKLDVILALLERVNDKPLDDSAYPLFFEAARGASVEIGVATEADGALGTFEALFPRQPKFDRTAHETAHGGPDAQ